MRIADATAAIVADAARVRAARRVLMITPHFPPDSSAAAHRVRILAPHLASAGWDPTVLTLRPDAYEGRLDASLGELVPASLRVVRVPAWPAHRTRLFGIGDLGLRSVWPLRRAATDLLSRERFDAVFITIYPTYTALLGSMLKRRFNVPFVLDYQDPWVGEWGRSVGPGPRGAPDWKSRATRAIGRRLEPIALRAADGVTAVSRRTFEEPLARIGNAAPAACAEIPLGGDPCDIAFLRSHPRPNRWFTPHDGVRHICSVGTILPRATGTVRALLSAIKGIDRVRLHFFGTSNQWGEQPARVLPLARDAGVAEIVSEHAGRLDYLDALQVLSDADVNLVLGSDEPHYTASRLYPALMAATPIVAVVHRASTVVAMLTQSGGLHQTISFGDGVAAMDRAPDIARALVSAADASPRRRALEAATDVPWSGARLAHELAGVFDRVAAR